MTPPSITQPGTARETFRHMPKRWPPRERGAFAIMCAFLLIVILAMCALAVDMGGIYNRKREVQAIAEELALAAARELDGTPAGIAAAQSTTRAMAEDLIYQYRVRLPWSAVALSFSAAPDRDGYWVDASTASGAAANLYYAKVDTAALDAAVGTVQTLFLPVLSNALSTVHVNDSAVAGRTAIDITPVAICAMQRGMATARPSTAAPNAELVQFGFRRGVSYDLMALSPVDTTPLRYVMNPAVAPGAYSASFDTSNLGPFACAGDVWMPRILGGNVRVSPLPASAPLQALYRQLNTRFDDYSSGDCSPYGTPPDYNVRAYKYEQANGVPWMRPTTGRASAASATSRGWLETIADLPAPPSGTAAGDYGPLWAYTQAVKFSSWTTYGTNEPRTGYAVFATGDWPALYPATPTDASQPKSPTASNYAPQIGMKSPYWATATWPPFYQAPSSAYLKLSRLGRRVLHVPLLQCPVPAGANVGATVLGIGKFFMTRPATPDSLIAEFAGLQPESGLSGRIELFP